MNNITNFIRRTTHETISGEVMNEQVIWDKLEELQQEYGGHCELKYEDGSYKCKLFLPHTSIGSWFPEAKDRDRLFAMVKCIKLVEDTIGKIKP